MDTRTPIRCGYSSRNLGLKLGSLEIDYRNFNLKDWTPVQERKVIFTSNLVDLYSESQASLIADDTQPSLSLTNTSTGGALRVSRTLTGGSSIGLMQVSVSGASVPVFQLQANSFVSAVSIIFAAATGWAGMGGIRVQLSDGITYGWIPIVPSAQFTAAAI